MSPSGKTEALAQCDPAIASQGPYTPEFFEGHRVYSEQSARRIVPAVLGMIPCRSVLDVGCGTGNWLAAFLQADVRDILGIDGDYVDRDLLQIPRECFRSAELRAPLQLGRRFDLVVSLEVAEHLPAESAATFVDSLARHADSVLFSAAIPGQDGTNHVNEQPPQYWAAMFRERGFLPIDALRMRFWNDRNVKWWYAQNSLLYVTAAKLEELPELKRFEVAADREVACLIHPEMFARIDVARKFAEDLGNKTSRQLLAALRSALTRAIAFRWRRATGNAPPAEPTPESTP